MIQLSGEEHFSQELGEIRPRLTDLEFLAKSIPGLLDIERTEPRLLVCRVQPELLFLKGTLKITIEIVDEQSPDFVRTRIHSKGIGSSAVVETEVKLSAAETGTRLNWSAEVTELGGLLRPVSRGLILAAARKVITEAWVGFRNALG